MAVSVMQVGVMRMTVPQRLMAVPVRMRLRHGAVVTVLVVQVMDVAVLVLERVVFVFVIVTFGEMHR